MLPASHRQQGFTYIFVIFLVAMISVALLAGRVVDATETRHNRELALIAIGHQFRDALASYAQSSGGVTGPNAYPTTLDDLIEDKRFPNTRRHLRKLFYDPLTGRQDWGLLRSGDRIVGIYSLAEGAPLKQAGFDGNDSSMNGAEKYSDWVFAWPVNGVAAPLSPH